MAVPSRIAPALFAGLLLGCDAVPTGPLDGKLWALVSIDGHSLPARPAAFVNAVVGDTLEFGVQSSMWRPQPLARSIRWYATAVSEEWWYTYDPAPQSEFAIRGLCADGDLASCADASATATVDGDVLTIRFRDSGLGRLEYRRVR